jgi:membrane AbrB-like protein
VRKYRHRLAPPLLTRLPLPAQWAVLAAISIFSTILFEWLRLPAAQLLGPMAAGIIVESRGGTLRMPSGPINFSQAVIGCLIARSFTPDIFSMFGRQWPLFLSVVAITLIASAALGWAISKLRILQGTTAVWGLLPGAASVMVLMADAFGADVGLVAFMQYLRVVLVAITASLVARFWFQIPAAMGHGMDWFPPIAWTPFASTLLIIAISSLAALAPRIPAGVLFAAMFIGGALHAGGIAVIELPPWLLAIGYAFLGWSIGLRFNRDVLAAAARALPQCMLSIAAIILFCAGMAALLVRVLGIDPLTAYLATSPGGVDSVAIIAASTKVDMPFVMALQSVRFLMILMIGPALARFVACLAGGRERGSR